MSRDDTDLIFVINLIGLAVVIGTTLILKLIVRIRGRVSPKPDFNRTTAPPPTLLPLLFKVVGYVARAWALVEAFAYFARFIGSFFWDIERPKGLITFLFVGALLWLSRACLRQARRLKMRSAEELLVQDLRPPVLYLRGFATEETALPANLWFDLTAGSTLLEEAVLSQFHGIGPVVGLRNAKLRGQPSEYAPFDMPVEDWKRRADALIKEAAVIVLAVAPTPGVSWEVRQIRERKALAHTLFILPPKESLATIRWLLAELSIPNEYKFLMFGEGKPLVIVMSEPQARAYRDTGESEPFYAHAVEAALKDLGLASKR